MAYEIFEIRTTKVARGVRETDRLKEGGISFGCVCVRETREERETSLGWIGSEVGKLSGPGKRGGGEEEAGESIGFGLCVCV